GQLRSILHRLELMPLVPLVEGVQVDQKETPPGIRQRPVGLQRDRLAEGFRNPALACERRTLTLLGCAPVECRERLEDGRWRARLRALPCVDDAVEPWIGTEREDQ